MLEFIFIFLGLAAIIFTIVSTLPQFDTVSQVVYAGMAMVLWMVWALQSTEIEPNHGGADVGYTALLIIGGLFAIAMFVSVLMKSIELMGE